MIGGAAGLDAGSTAEGMVVCGRPTTWMPACVRAALMPSTSAVRCWREVERTLFLFWSCRMKSL